MEHACGFSRDLRVTRPRSSASTKSGAINNGLSDSSGFLYASLAGFDAGITVSTEKSRLMAWGDSTMAQCFEVTGTLDPVFGSFEVFAGQPRWLLKGAQVCVYRVWCLSSDGDGFTIFTSYPGKNGISVRKRESVDISATEMYATSEKNGKGAYQFLK
jgi:hypothetical protein